MRRQATPIDWDSIPVSIQQGRDPNPQNHHAAASAEERAVAFRGLARKILLRRAQRIAQN
jgi:hypothetical protein